MYAVIKTGGKQYRVSKGDVLRVEKLAGEAGSSIEFGEVLMVGGEDGVKVGAPFVDGAKVTAEVASHGRGKKVKILKFKRRKQYMKRMGHRQDYTELRITDISA